VKGEIVTVGTRHGRRGRVARLGISLVLLTSGLVVVGTTNGQAATPDKGVVSSDAPVRWTGQLRNDVPAYFTLPVGNHPGLPRDYFELKVDLPAGVWSQPGGVQVGVRTPYDPLTYDLELFVYDKNGREVARSAAADSDVESVLLPNAANGKYLVEVVALQATGGVTYEGLAEVERAPAVEPVRELLPNLVVLPQRNIQFGEFPATGQCEHTEFVEQGARRCLRFDQSIGNVGDGPMEIQYTVNSVATDQRLLQRIYSSDGTFRDRQADSYEFHAAHSHFHYKNFALSRLWESDAAGTRLGSQALREGKKNGFCLIDVENFAFGQKGDAARTYTSCAPDKRNVGDVAQVNGISNGWTDVYNSYLPDQYIEVTGLPDGFYVLETVVDPADTIVEQNDSDNDVSVHLQICGDAAGIVGPGNPCQ
jgi:hypothetical protein